MRNIFERRSVQPEDLMHEAAVRGAYLDAAQSPGRGVKAAAASQAAHQAGVDVHPPAAASRTAGLPEEKAPLRVDGRAQTASQRVDEAYQYGQQYLNNPFTDKGRRRTVKQALDYPLGGHVRNFLEGQEVFGHVITADQALIAERSLAGLTAVGVGVPAFMAAVNQLSTPQTPDTIPLA